MKKILLSLTMVGALILTPAIIASASSSDVEFTNENTATTEGVEVVETNTGYECPLGNDNCQREECLNGTGECSGLGNGECNGTGLGNGNCNGQGNGNGSGLGNGSGRNSNMGGRGNCNR